MRVFLVRHGIKEKSAGDPGLSSVGREQARRMGGHLKKFAVDKVLASPLLRTRQTAELISQELGMTYAVDNNLRERMNWGDMPGQSFEEFIAEWTKATSDRDHQPNPGYSSRNAGKRIERVIKEQAEHTVENLVLVTHGGIVTDFLRNIFSEDVLDHAYDTFSQNLDTVIKECSVTVVDYRDETFTLISLATVDHLSVEMIDEAPDFSESI